MTAAKQGALTVEDALERILAHAEPITDTEDVPLFDAQDRVLAKPVSAKLTQPPFTASAMDGYAVRAADVGALPATLRVIGESAAGHAFGRAINPGEAVRIFTGAPLPPQADAIVIQENTKRDGDLVHVVDGKPDDEHVRPMGGDFAAGDMLIDANRIVNARTITLAAAGGHASLTVRRRPVVALLATGDELVLPGETPRADQIVCSNPFGIAAMVRQAGGEPRFLGIARDNPADLKAQLERGRHADIIVTIGGASVGDHDLVGPVLTDMGLSLAFWKIAMRPGKPLMFGRLGDQRVIGLPGNPVSSLICTRVFLVPLIRALLGLVRDDVRALKATTTVELERNGPRAHYMRGKLGRAADGSTTVTPVRSQDSSLLTPLAAADCLIVRPINAAVVAAGGSVTVLPLEF